MSQPEYLFLHLRPTGIPDRDPRKSDFSFYFVVVVAAAAAVVSTLAVSRHARINVVASLLVSARVFIS